MAAVLAVVVGLSGVVLVLARPGHSGKPAADTLRVVNALPSDSATPEPSESPTATPSASNTPNPSDSPTAASTSGSGGGGGGGGSDSGAPVMTDLGPIPPGSTVYAYSPGRDSWSATGDGITLHVSMSPAHPHAGQTVTFSFNATAPAKCCKGFILFGNGRATDNGTDCMEFPAGTGLSTSYTTIYNKSGRYEFEAVAYARSCDHNAGFYAWIDVADGTSSGQGPALPVVKIDSSTPKSGHEGDPAWLTLWGDATDDDGYITKLIVDWGDGTTDSFPGDGGPCQEAADGWPAGTEAMLPGEPNPPYHHYRSYGSFRVTLTAVSTACNGSDVERGHASMSWDNPAPPSPTPSPSTTPSP